MRFFFISVLVLFLASIAFAQNALPIAGTLDITFEDANGNPIPDATVEYTFVVSGTWDKPDTPTTRTAVTDSAGRITDEFTADARLYIPFKITLTYQGSQVYYNEEDTWQDFANKQRTLTVPIGALEIVVKDQKGRPLKGAEVLISDGQSQTEAVTNEYGVYSYAGGVSEIEYTVTVEYGTSAKHQTGSPPTSLEFELPAYDIVVRSVDDQGTRIEAGLTVEVPALGESFGASGEITLEQMPAGVIAVSARFGRATQETSVLVQGDAVEEIVFDLNPPVISEERTEPAQPGEGDVQIVAMVSDGAGVGVANVVLKYSVDKGAEQTVAMVPSGGSYIAAIPRQPAGSLVEYQVSATDENDNSKNGIRKSYVVLAGAGISSSTDSGTGDADSGTGGMAWLDQLLMGGGLIVLIGVVVLVIIAVIVLKKRK